jgi:hypothetical protein
LLALARRRDPAGIAGIVQRLTAEFDRRFGALASDIEESIVERDCFGIVAAARAAESRSLLTQAPLPDNALIFKTVEEKVAGFMSWLRAQEDAGVLDIVRLAPHGSRVAREWSGVYVQSYYAKALRETYEKAVAAAQGKLHRAGYTKPSTVAPLAMRMQQPIHVERIGLLYARAFEDLKSVLAVQEASIQRAIAEGLTLGLTRGMAEGRNPLDIARALAKDATHPVAAIGLNRVRMIARTEMSRAHTLATVAEYREAEAEGVHVEAELMTSGLDTVCEDCLELEEGGPYSLDEAEGLIPVHPNCMCTLIPVTKPGEKLAKRERGEPARTIDREAPAPVAIPEPTPPPPPEPTPPPPTEGDWIEPTPEEIAGCITAEGFIAQVEPQLSGIQKDIALLAEREAAASEELTQIERRFFEIRDGLDDATAQKFVDDYYGTSRATYAPGSPYREIHERRAQVRAERDIVRKARAAKEKERVEIARKAIFGYKREQVIQPFDLTLRSAAVPDSVKKTGQQARDFIGRLVKNPKAHRTRVFFREKFGSDGRASCGTEWQCGILQGKTVYSPGAETKVALLEAKADVSVKTMIHEMGHVIEGSDLDLRRACLEFLHERRGTEALRPLTTLCPGYGYRAHELAFKDRLLDPYIGKLYLDHSTEVFTTGLELLYEDPIRVAKGDPGYFDLIMRLARGVYRRSRSGSWGNLPTLDRVWRPPAVAP